VPGSLERETRLPDPARSEERDRATTAHEFVESLDLRLAPTERGKNVRQILPCDRGVVLGRSSARAASSSGRSRRFKLRATFRIEAEPFSEQTQGLVLGSAARTSFERADRART